LLTVTFQKLTADPKARAPTKNVPPPRQPLVRGIFIGIRILKSRIGGNFFLQWTRPLAPLGRD